MLYPVDHNGLLFFVDLIDDPVVTASSRKETFELPKQPFAEAVWILGYRTQDCRQRRFANLFRQAVQVPEAFRCDLDFIHPT